MGVNPAGWLPGRSLVDQSVFTGVLWGGVATSLIFVTFRLVVRLKTLRSLYLDDIFVVLGWLMVLATSIIWHFAAPGMFKTTAVETGQLSFLDDPTFVQDTEYYLRHSIAVCVLFYSSLVSVKLSFLFFFRKLTAGVDSFSQKIQWWIIFILVISTWLATVGDLEYQCLAPSLEEIATHCAQPWALKYQRATLIANCVLDIVTDILIITIPFAILRNARIRCRQKLALAGLFSLTIITVVFAIIRVAVVLRTQSKEPDVSWLNLLSAVEQNIAVIISCLASFRALFTRQDVNAKPEPGRYVTDASKPGLSRYPKGKRSQASIQLSELIVSDMTRVDTNGYQESAPSETYALHEHTV